MQLSVIQCNCAVRVLEALAPLAPAYVDDKLIILTVSLLLLTCLHETNARSSACVASLSLRQNSLTR